MPEQGKTFVFVVKDGVASKREVTTRPAQARARCKSPPGLEDGERVVVEGTQKVRDGAQVLEVDADRPPAVAAAT